jgi:hypothetical protein
LASYFYVVLFVVLVFGGCGEGEAPLVPTTLRCVGEPQYQGTINGPLSRPLQVLVVDQRDNPAAGVVVKFAVVHGLQLEITESDTTNAKGIAEADVTLGGVPGETTVIAASPGLKGSPLVLTVKAIPHLLRLFGPARDYATVGEALADPITATLSDALGNWMSGVTVHFTTKHGSVSDSAVVTTDMGRAFTRWTLGPRVGVQTLTASYGASLQSLEIEARAGPPDHLHKLSGDRQLVPWNSELSQPLEVRLEDRCGNPLSGVRLTISITQGSGTLKSMQQVTDSGGKARTSYVPKASALIHEIAFRMSGVSEVVFTVRAHAPISLQTTRVTPTAAQISWSEFADPETRRLDIFRSENEADLGLLVASPPDLSVRSFADTTVSLFHTYQYRLRAHLEGDLQIISPPHVVQVGPEFQVADFSSRGFELHLDSSREVVYASIEGGKVAVVSPGELRVVDSISLVGWGSVVGMDSDWRRLFVATTGGLHAVNADTRTILRSTGIPGAWDVVALPGTRIAVSQNARGNLLIVYLDYANSFKLVNPGLFFMANAWLGRSGNGATLFVLDTSDGGHLRALDVRTDDAKKLYDLVVGAEAAGRFAVHGDRILLKDGRYLSASDFGLVHDFDASGIPVISSDGTRAYVGNATGIIELDLQTLAVGRTIPQQGTLNDMVLNAEETGVWLLGSQTLRLLLFPP